MSGLEINLDDLVARLEALANLDVLTVATTPAASAVIGVCIFMASKGVQEKQKGLRGKFKIVGQIGLGLIVGLTLFYDDDVVVREFTKDFVQQDGVNEVVIGYQDIQSTITTIPFFKNNEFDYNLPFLPDAYTWIIYTLVVIVVMTAVFNGANLTDGLDGLAAGSSAIIAIGLAILAYISGNVIISDYLNIMYIPNAGELVIFCTALVGACIGFLWYNAYPAQIFMGDTGSLSLGGIIAVLALTIRKELLIPLLCGIFLIENLSVIIQSVLF